MMTIESCPHLVLVLAVKAKLVLRLAVRDLVVAVPLVDLGQQTGLLALNVLNVYRASE